MQGYALLCVGFPSSDLEVETQDEDEVRYYTLSPPPSINPYNTWSEGEVKASPWKGREGKRSNAVLLFLLIPFWDTAEGVRNVSGKEEKGNYCLPALKKRWSWRKQNPCFSKDPPNQKDKRRVDSSAYISKIFAGCLKLYGKKWRSLDWRIPDVCRYIGFNLADILHEVQL